MEEESRGTQQEEVRQTFRTKPERGEKEKARG